MATPVAIDDLDVDLADIDNLPTIEPKEDNILPAAESTTVLDSPHIDKPKSHESFIPRPAALLTKKKRDPQVQQAENILREKYKDVGADADITELYDSMKNRRIFAEKLEHDQDFQRKYLAHEEKKRRAKLDQIINNLESHSEPSTSNEPDKDDLPSLYDTANSEPLPLSVIPDAAIKPGVLIQNVAHLTINIHI